MSIRIVSTLLSLFLITPTTYSKANVAAGQFDFENAPNASVTSPVFTLAKDQSIRVTLVSGGNDFTFDVFIYNSATKELMGMTDQDSTEPYFSWTTPEGGSFYAVLRNTTSSAGKSSLIVMPAGSRGVVRGQLASAAHVKVFYATNRHKTNTDPDHATYGSEPSPEPHLEYGIAGVSIPRDHRMGELEGPTIYKLEFKPDAEKHIVMDSALSETKEKFFGELKNSLTLPEKSLFVFVHGFNVTFEEAVRRTAQIKYDLGFDGTAVLYSWPSQGKMGFVSYHQDEQNSKDSAAYLQAFLKDLADQTKATSIHLIAHSMGNRVAVAALAAMAHDRVRISHVALMAPDMQAVDFLNMAKVMKGSANDVTLYASSQDAALKASQMISGYPRAGEGGSKVLVLPGVFETIDASDVDTSILGVLHSYYADNSTILSDLFQLIRGQAAKDRFGLQKMTNGNGNYWSFRPSSR